MNGTAPGAGIAINLPSIYIQFDFIKRLTGKHNQFTVVTDVKDNFIAT